MNSGKKVAMIFMVASLALATILICFPVSIQPTTTRACRYEEQHLRRAADTPPSTQPSPSRLSVAQQLKQNADNLNQEEPYTPYISGKISRLRAMFSRLYGILPLEDNGGLRIRANGMCDIKFPNSTEGASQRPRVAVSLLVMEHYEWLAPTMLSFVASDILLEADVAIFVWYNMNNSKAYKYMQQVTGVPIIEVPNPDRNNSGIVVPRIRIMEHMLAHGCNFQWFMEMHDDMYFFQRWFKPLIDHDKPGYGIIMPFVVSGSAYS